MCIAVGLEQEGAARRAVGRISVPLIDPPAAPAAPKADLRRAGHHHHVAGRAGRARCRSRAESIRRRSPPVRRCAAEAVTPADGTPGRRKACAPTRPPSAAVAPTTPPAATPPPEGRPAAGARRPDEVRPAPPATDAAAEPASRRPRTSPGTGRAAAPAAVGSGAPAFAGARAPGRARHAGAPARRWRSLTSRRSCPDDRSDDLQRRRCQAQMADLEAAGGAEHAPPRARAVGGQWPVALACSARPPRRRPCSGGQPGRCINQRHHDRSVPIGALVGRSAGLRAAGRRRLARAHRPFGLRHAAHHVRARRAEEPRGGRLRGRRQPHLGSQHRGGSRRLHRPARPRGQAPSSRRSPPSRCATRPTATRRRSPTSATFTPSSPWTRPHRETRVRNRTASKNRRVRALNRVIEEILHDVARPADRKRTRYEAVH